VRSELDSLLAQTEHNEVCPSCGAVTKLNDATGFCRDCSRDYCDRCGDPSPTTLCVSCRRIRWLETNAEAIEDQLLDGLTFRRAVLVVANSIRPTCIICEEPINRGTSGRHFICSKHAECRKARRRYKYLIYDKGYSKDAAIEVILQGRQDDSQ
jgi:hypothetical protein